MTQQFIIVNDFAFKLPQMNLRVCHNHFRDSLPFVKTGVSDLVFGKMDGFLSEINRLDHKLQEL